jgi:type I restriction enzyme S subunit
MKVYGVSKTQLLNVKIPLPPTLSEQKANATALSYVDALISSLEKLIAKKKAIKQGAMQELLTPPNKGGRRLPGFNGEWEEKTLDSLIHDYQNGYAFSASGYQNEGIPIVTMAQIGLNGQFQFDENKVNYWSSDVIKDLKSFTLYKGDLIMSMTDVTPEKNLIGRMAIVNQQGPLFLNQRVGLIRINKNLVNPIILKHLSNMRPWRTYSKAIASLGVQANIGTTDIKNGTFWLPKIEEQNAISQVLSDMDLEIEALEAKKEKYNSIKGGMMQELLTGKTRLV